MPTGLAVAGAREIHSPLCKVWQCIIDVESYPSTYSTCISVERLGIDRNESLKEGSQWRETGRIGKRYYNAVATVTELKANSSIVITVTSEGATRTSTSTVEAIDDKSCLVTVSYAMVSNHLWSKCWTTIFRSRIRRKAQAAIMKDLDGLAVAVEGTKE